jgi:hypothetical protein
MGVIAGPFPKAEQVVTAAIAQVSRTASKRSSHLHPVAGRHHERLKALGELPRDGVGAEVGVFEGDNACTLLRVTRPQHLFLIDPWQSEPGLGAGLYSGRSESEATMDARCQRVQDRFHRQVAAGQVSIHRMTSAEAAEELDLSLDYAYVDGDHRYEGVKADLETYAEVLRPGGILLGDDYGIRGWWNDGVKTAVDEFTAERDLPLTLFGSQFLIRLP